MRSTIRSDAADRDSGYRSRSKPGDLSRARTFALAPTTVKTRTGDHDDPDQWLWITWSMIPYSFA
jgi:hypothetical protein